MLALALRLVAVTAYCTNWPGRTGSGAAVIVTCVMLLASTIVAALARARLRPVAASRRSAAAATTLPLAACALTVTTNCRCPVALAASAPTFHCTSLPLRVAPSLADTKLVPAGTGTASTAPTELAPLGLPKRSV